MILEVAILKIRPGRSLQFESAFAEAQNIIMAMPGYVSHELQRCIESENQYILLVRWQQLDDHLQGFRQSSHYENWQQLLHHFYEPFPTVEHYQLIHSGSYSSINPKII